MPEKNGAIDFVYKVSVGVCSLSTSIPTEIIFKEGFFLRNKLHSNEPSKLQDFLNELNHKFSSELSSLFCQHSISSKTDIFDLNF